MCALLAAVNAFAFNIEYNSRVTIDQPVYENLYISGGTVIINAPVYKDLIVAGGTIEINDSVRGDILLLGGDVTFNGYTGGDLRCAGARLHILKNIDGDLAVVGGNVFVNKDVTVSGRLLLAGGNIHFDGRVKNNVTAIAANLYFNGIAENEMNFRGGSLEMSGTVMGSAILAASQIVINGTASFNDSVRYWNKEGKLDFKSSLKSGKATYDPSLAVRPGSRWYYLGAATALGLFWYLGMALLMIAVIQFLFPGGMRKAAEIVFNSPLSAMGAGILFFIGAPIAACIALITLIGIPAGVLIIAGYIVLIVLATVITSVVTANWLNNRFTKNWTLWKRVFVALGIFILFKVLSFLPFLGWLIMFIAASMAFGGIIKTIKWKRAGIIAAD